mmetsp:Transcript_42673/g.81487  ORF Transcript_42673/g.81487 Transcript_42673/m.81487 type:complete len:80 (+) Transcript_42673:2701-2940(+)
MSNANDCSGRWAWKDAVFEVFVNSESMRHTAFLKNAVSDHHGGVHQLLRKALPLLSSYAIRPQASGFLGTRACRRILSI